jgi:hypothetical protein
LPGTSSADGWAALDSWSPDGRFLAGIITATSGVKAGVGVYDLETSKLLTIPMQAIGEAWLPDGKHLLVARPRDFVVVQPWTGETKVLPIPEPLNVGPWGLRLSRDGRTICLNALEEEGDIWMLKESR